MKESHELSRLPRMKTDIDREPLEKAKQTSGCNGLAGSEPGQDFVRLFRLGRRLHDAMGRASGSSGVSGLRPWFYLRLRSRRGCCLIPFDGP